MKNTNQYPGVDAALFIKVKNKLIKIKSQDIYMIKSIGDYVRIHTADQKYTLHTTMKSITNKLPVKDFIRVHQSYIVRFDKITVINKDGCVVNNEEVPISQAERKNLLIKINIIGP
ncbi:MAG: LytTR family DNA-binding domain-containing protein [Bacteroidia bacterium]|nr:LytTR family DNA-binding domain-containing protein [Bacteroidia bacterium]